MTISQPCTICLFRSVKWNVFSTKMNFFPFLLSIENHQKTYAVMCNDPRQQKRFPHRLKTNKRWQFLSHVLFVSSGLSNEMYFQPKWIFFPFLLSIENHQKTYTVMLPSTDAKFPPSHLSPFSCYKERRRIKYHHVNATFLNCCTFNEEHFVWYSLQELP